MPIRDVSAPRSSLAPAPSGACPQSPSERRSNPDSLGKIHVDLPEAPLEVTEPVAAALLNFLRVLAADPSLPRPEATDSEGAGGRWLFSTLRDMTDRHTTPATECTPHAHGVSPLVIRFAFAGRCSTEDLQDPEASRNWQLTRVRALIEPAGGHIVTEYFDIGHSRSLPWQRRPRANALLKALRDPHRGFDAVVIGEPQRTFYGNQFGNTFPVFVHFHIPLWVPEVGGPIDPDNEAHDLVMSVFGGMSKGERNRIKIRVRTAMSSQDQLQGRHLGGRPHTGTCSATPGPTRIRRRPRPDSASTGWNPTPPPPPSWRGSSRCTSAA